ncbi:hypothetical protein OPT61_g9414 [Boeremia exigua]|uniref:Uncharacterized protein n=1 Tax=Boeremia exigua TaxID=749465 RepID=A0ACC2HVB1_9PLEO|nr:hypothetical protein OPT61_g9414 [Boeremia exigua]
MSTRSDTRGDQAEGSGGDAEAMGRQVSLRNEGSDGFDRLSARLQTPGGDELPGCVDNECMGAGEVGDNSERGAVSTKLSGADLLATWWIEIVSLLTAIGALAAIVAIIAVYDGKEQPAWKYAINLNILIAVLSTLLRASKFSSDQSAEMDTVPPTQATATPRSFGYCVPWTMGSAGALLQDGDAQAVKTIPCDLPIASEKASIKVSRWMHHANLARISEVYWDMNTDDRVTYWDVDMDTKVAILDGLTNSNTKRFEISPSCSTGNCTFPSYKGITHSSVGICKKCVDVTPWVTKEPQLHQYPNGTTVGAIFPRVYSPDSSEISQAVRITRLSGSGTIWKHRPSALNELFPALVDDTLRDIFRSSIYNVSVITFTNNSCGRPMESIDMGPTVIPSHNASCVPEDSLNVVAARCSFYPCVRDYQGSVRNTLFTENTVSETPIHQGREFASSSIPSFLRFHTPCLIDGQEYTVENISLVPKDNHNFTSSFIDDENVTFPTECAYGIFGIYALSLIDFMSDTLLGNFTPPNRIVFTGQPDDYNSVVCSPWYLKGLVNKGNASFASIDAAMQAIASAVTSEMRKQGSDWNSTLRMENSEDKSEAETIYAWGSAVRTTVCIEFDWMWLSFPLGLIVLTTLLLGVVGGKMVSDRRGVPAWKSSVLPLLFMGNQIENTVEVKDMKSINTATQRLVVKLAHDGRGWEFVNEDCRDEGKKVSQRIDS